MPRGPLDRKLEPKKNFDANILRWILVAVGFELVWLAGGQYTPKTNIDTQKWWFGFGWLVDPFHFYD